jgi:hypothetical protein
MKYPMPNPIRSPQHRHQGAGARRAETAVTVYGYARVSTGGESVDRAIGATRASQSARIARTYNVSASTISRLTV